MGKHKNKMMKEESGGRKGGTSMGEFATQNPLWVYP